MAKNTESMIQRALLVKGNTGGRRLFRNNVGTATTKDGRHISFGLQAGSGDLIGWEQIEITPEMVGDKIARFLSVEVKSEKGRASEKQKNWAEVVNKCGGRAIIIKSIEDLC
jgi:hypothetical protein